MNTQQQIDALRRKDILYGEVDITKLALTAIAGRLRSLGLEIASNKIDEAKKLCDEALVLLGKADTPQAHARQRRILSKIRLGRRQQAPAT